MPSRAFTLAQLAPVTGASVEDLQLYEDGGLLQPARRRTGRSGDVGYFQEHVDRVRFIQRAIAYGFTVEDIRRLVDRTALLTCGDVYRLALGRLDAIKAVWGTNDTLVVALERLVGRCSRTGGQQDCQILRDLEKPEGPPQLLRDIAAGLRQLAPTLPEADREHYLQRADALEREAAALDKRMDAQ